MKRFARLFAALDATTKTSAKTEALAAYFREAPEEDRLWTDRPPLGPPPQAGGQRHRTAGMGG